MQKFSFRAQGGLEYLLVISMVILIAAVVITALPYVMNTPGQFLPEVDNALNSMRGNSGLSDIVVTNSSFNPDEKTAFISLISNSGAPYQIVSVKDSAGNSVSFSGGGFGGGGGGNVDSNSGPIIVDPLPAECSCDGKAPNTNIICHLTVELQNTYTGSKSIQYVKLNSTCGGKQNGFALGSCVALQSMAIHPDWNYYLTNNIDCSFSKTWFDGNGFKPIGNASAPFTGVLDGNNFTISNLYINRPAENNVGLFGYQGVSSSVIDLSLEDANIYGGANVGSFFGTCNGDGLLNSNLLVIGQFVSVQGLSNLGWGCGASTNPNGGDTFFDDSSVIQELPTAMYGSSS